MIKYGIAFTNLNYDYYHIDITKVDKIIDFADRKYYIKSLHSSFIEKVTFYLRINVLDDVNMEEHRKKYKELINEILGEDIKLVNEESFVHYNIRKENLDYVPYDDIEEVKEILLNDNISIINLDDEKIELIGEKITKKELNTLMNYRNNINKTSWFDWFKIGEENNDQS